MNILVLGGDGFLGSHVVDQLVPTGHEITVFDRFPYRISRNLEHHRNSIRFISGEFQNRDDLFKALSGKDIVYHFVSATNPAASWNDPLIEVEENIRSSIMFFELAVRQGVKKIVFPSSGGTVYGPQNLPVDENTIPQPLSPYGIAKLTTEHFLNYFRLHYGIASDIYRIGNPYGSRQPVMRPQGVIAVWMHEILNGSEIQIYGNNTTFRDYIYIKDVAYLMSHSLKNLVSSDVYNLGSGIGTSIMQLLNIFQQVVDIPFRYRIQEKRPSDNSSIVLDSSKLMKLFPGFRCQKLEEKIDETWTYFKTSFHEPDIY